MELEHMLDVASLWAWRIGTAVVMTGLFIATVVGSYKICRSDRNKRA